MLKQTLTEAENKYISRPVIHRKFVHRRSDLIVCGLFLISGGFCFIAYLLGWALQLPDNFPNFAIASAFFIFTKDFIPCKCGKKPILTSRHRREILKRNSNGAATRAISRFATAVLAGSLSGIALAAISIMLIKLMLPILGHSLTVFLFCSPIIVFGFFILGCGVLDKELPWIKDVSSRELEEMAKLRCDTKGELNQLIAFNLRIGEFATANAYSQKLLKMVEDSESTIR